jgi:hypothetical protein
VGDLSTPFSPIDRISREKIHNVLDLTNTMDKMDLTDVYRVYHQIATDCTFFSAAYGTFSKIDHILGHKANINK